MMLGPSPFHTSFPGCSLRSASRLQLLRIKTRCTSAPPSNLARLGITKHAAGRRIFATTSRCRKDEVKARTWQQEQARGQTEKESIKPESIQKAPASAPAAASGKQDSLLAEKTTSTKEQRKADWAIMKEMSRYLWPKDNLGTRFRVGLSVGLLVGAKVRLLCIVIASKLLIGQVGSQCTSSFLLQVHSRLHEH